MQQMTYTLDMFEGPLDLLLHLIEQHKLDIRDIPIALLLEQYLAALDKQGTVDPDSMSEFLMMATKLIYIKSRMLLPMEEGEEDPRAELVSMLADYLHYKELAGELGGRYEQYGRRLFVRPQEQMGQQPPELRQQPLPTLLEAYKAGFRSRLRRVPPPIESFSGIIVHKAVSVATKTFELLRGLLRKGRLRVYDVIYSQTSRSDAIAAFMAILELSARSRVGLSGEGEQMELTLKKEGQAVG